MHRTHRAFPLIRVRMTPRCRPLIVPLLRHRQSALHSRGPVSSHNRILTGAAVSHASICSAQLGIGRPSSSNSPLSTASSCMDDDRLDEGDVYSESDIKEGILAAALEFVPTHGWTRESIVEAALKFGYPGVAHGKRCRKKLSIPTQEVKLLPHNESRGLS